MEQVDFKTLQWRAAALRILLPAFVVTRLVVAFCDASGLLKESATGDAADIAGVMALLFLIVFPACAVLTAMWLHKANANLRAAGIDMAFTPNGAWGWYFVPIANLFKPYQAMREIWNESHRTPDSFAGDGPTLLNVWWGCWVIGNILSNLSFRMSSLAPEGSFVVVNAVEAVVICAAALLLLRIVRNVTAAQATLGEAHVFA